MKPPASANNRLELTLQNATQETELPLKEDILCWASMAIGDRVPAAELSIRLVDIPEIQQLNKRYRHQDKPTNVLAFPAQLPKDLPLDVVLLGDVVICAPIVRQEASEQQKPLMAHWAHMVIHGVLHLLGYDHVDSKEALQMELLETSLLEQLGYPDPYQNE